MRNVEVIRHHKYTEEQCHIPDSICRGVAFAVL